MKMENYILRSERMRNGPLRGKFRIVAHSQVKDLATIAKGYFENKKEVNREIERIYNEYRDGSETRYLHENDFSFNILLQHF